MGREISIAFIGLALLATEARADGTTDSTSGLNLGGPLKSGTAAASTARQALVEGGGFSAGLLEASGTAVPGMEFTTPGTGGYLAWNLREYRIDATVRSLSTGGFSADVGATTGSLQANQGTSYGLRLGTGWVSDPTATFFGSSTRWAVSESSPSNNDVNLTLTVNHALTPNLSLIGGAEARHYSATGASTDYSLAPSEYILGAGLGLRF